MSRGGAAHTRTLLLVLAFLLAVAVILTVVLDPAEHNMNAIESRAASRMAAAFSVLIADLEARGIAVENELDPNRTGLIGEEFTALTTTVGVLSSKRTSTNPAFAALLVAWLSQLGIEAGEHVLITLSGSFPALGVSAIVACEELDIVPVILSSVGASMYGANRPDLTWLDIESVLQQNGVIRHTSSYVTLGGEDDIGLSYPELGRETALAAIRRHDVPLILEDDAAAQWLAKVSILETLELSALINIGGNQLSIGSDGYLLPPGIISRDDLTAARFGLIGWFVEQDLPVVHLLHIQELALQNGIPQDPIPLPNYE